MDKWIVINAVFLILLTMLASARVFWFNKVDPAHRYKLAPYFHWFSSSLLVGILLAYAILSASEHSGQILIDPGVLGIPSAILFLYWMRVKFCKNCGATINKAFNKRLQYCSECGS